MKRHGDSLAIFGLVFLLAIVGIGLGAYRKALIDMGWTPPGALADTLRSFASGYAQESARYAEIASEYGGYYAGIRDTFMVVANGLHEEADCIESKKETPNG